jgi:hypothetical protein
LIGTQIEPSRADPKYVATNPNELRDSRPTRSPLATPRAASALATRMAVASSSA